MMNRIKNARTKAEMQVYKIKNWYKHVMEYGIFHKRVEAELRRKHEAYQAYMEKYLRLVEESKSEEWSKKS